MAKSTRALRNSVLVVVLMVIAAANAAAFTFSPMSATIAPSGVNAVITFKVTNDSSTQTAVAIKVMTRVIDVDGNETNEAADKLFLVFPARVVLQPNSSQSVKVQYRGSSGLPSEIAYRVIAEQLPVEFTKSTSSGVNILLRYVAALYVAPKNISPHLVFKTAKAGEKDGKKGLFVTVENDGTKHALLSDPLLKIQPSAGAATIELSGEPLAEINGQNILAKSSRTFFVPWDSVVAGKVYEGAFSAEIE